MIETLLPLSLFPVSLFPEGALSSSVVTTVWLGVLVVAYFNLRFGWVLSGLVVPGYLVPLLLIKPWSVLAILLEAAGTYLAALLLSRIMTTLTGACDLFGRDRFFMLVLLSVGVRLLGDSWLFPLLGQWVETHTPWHLDYRNNLHSFGLVIVALIANMYWKPGLVRGSGVLLTCLGLTFLLVRFVLMPLTNFSISNLGYMYEDIATSLLASPKAYMILLVSAWVASRMNLRYGWEYNGILIPSLLALQWYQPLKVLATFVEAFVILLLAHALLALPWLARRNIEGARQLLLFFNIGFVYKLALGYVLVTWFPAVKVTDYYAFGYLLATLLAIKMYDKSSALRMTRATLQTSLVGMLVATLIGFSLAWLPSLGDAGRLPPVQAAQVQAPQVSEASLEELVEHYRLAMLERRGQPMARPMAAEIDAFIQGVEHLASGDGARRMRALERLTAAGYEVLQAETHFWVLRERLARGWGIFIIDARQESGLLIEAPVALAERDVAIAASRLLKRFSARAVAISGAELDANPDGSANVLLQPKTLFHSFHRALAARNILQLRRYTAPLARQTAGVPQADRAALESLPLALFVKRRLPDGLPVAGLKALIGDYQVRWETPAFPNLQRDETHSGFAELFLTPQALRLLLARTGVDEPDLPLEVSELTIEGYLQRWLLDNKALLGSAGAGQYRVATRAELLYFDEEILNPLFAVSRRYYEGQRWLPEGIEVLQALNRKAALFGYRLMRYRHRSSAQDFLILTEMTGDTRRFWGTYVLRLGAAAPVAVQVPRPLYERNTFEYGLSLYERLQAQLLMVAGSHPRTHPDGSADVVRAGNLLTLFNTVHQSWLNLYPGQGPLVLQMRAFGWRPDLTAMGADLLLASARLRPAGVPPGALEQRLLTALRGDGLRVEAVQGQAATAGYEAGPNPQYHSALARGDVDFAVAWLSPELRSNYRQQAEDSLEEKIFYALDIPQERVDVAAWLRRHDWHARPPVNSERALARLQPFLETRNILALSGFQQGFPGWQLRRLVDVNTGQSFVALSEGRERALVAVANLNPVVQQRQSFVAAPDEAAISQFIHSRVAWLVPEARP